jgi:hypothetical protein
MFDGSVTKNRLVYLRTFVLILKNVCNRLKLYIGRSFIYLPNLQQVLQQASSQMLQL